MKQGSYQISSGMAADHKSMRTVGEVVFTAPRKDTASMAKSGSLSESDRRKHPYDQP